MSNDWTSVNERPTCADCGATAPPTHTNYTLIGSSHGWRLTKGQNAGGAMEMQWRCPKCWERHRGKR
jgi:hypothetical protein